MLNRWSTVLILAFSLGLAPFVPEPHIVGKLRWIAGGGSGMQPMDYIDLLFHGLPWLLLVRLMIIKALGITGKPKAN
ncbi:MAG: hypothetical protein RIF33_02845 [Cyclobacteriaceae bacterium]